MRRTKTAIRWATVCRGFTLVEMLIAVMISFIILAAIFEVFITQKKRYVTEDAILEMENRGDFAIEYLTRIIQNSGYNIRQGMKFEAASDHYFVTAMDENNDNVVAPEELVTIAVNKSTRDIAAGDQPTELVRDPDMDDFTSGKRSFGFDAYFDMDGNGNVDDTERFVSGYDINTARNDSSLDQQDSVRLFLADGPPYAVYRYGLTRVDENSPYDSAANPYIIDPTPDLIAGNVDNFIIRYYDEENLPLPVTFDDAGRRITPKPPYLLTRTELTRIRRVEFEVLIRSAREDTKWNDSGAYPAGSVATYDANGRPAGWSCGDAEFRAAEPYLTDCAGLSDWDCFYKHCNNKQFPTLVGNKVDYTDHYRRLLLTSSVTPKNLTLNPYGQLTLTVTPVKVRCPDTSATLTATLRDREGNPIDDAVVNFYSTSLVSTLDFSGVSEVDVHGDPVTNEDGSVSGITLRALALPDGSKKPVSVTVSADTAITITVGGVERSIPIYSSVVVPFVVGPPATVELINAPPDTVACKTDAIETFALYAEDCNGFPSEGATITVTPYDPVTSSTEFAEGVQPGTFHREASRTSETITDRMVDYSGNEDDNGKYVVYYASPMITTSGDIYPPSVGITFEVTTFDGLALTDSVPDGWGYASNPIPDDPCAITIMPGAIKTITTDPPTYSGTGCEEEYFDFAAFGYDCGGAATWNSYPIWTSIFSSGTIMGTLNNLVGGDLGTSNASMVWDTGEQKYRLVFVNTGCATGDTNEGLEFLNYDKSGTTPPEPAGSTMGISLTQCPTGLSITLKAREPHTTMGTGTLTDGFYQSGCDYDNIDVVANVILNIPPDTLCNDVQYNPVTLTVESGGARFLDTGGNPTLTTTTVNTDATGTAFAGLKLTATSLADVVISATSYYGTSPVYTDSETITFQVGEENIVFAYRDGCYTDLLTPANALRTDDYMYLEVQDCNRNENILAADTTTATVYRFLSAIGDTEEVILTETGNSTGIFRGKVKTRALPPGWTSANNDGVLDIINGSFVNVRYQDDDLNEYFAYEPFNIPTILDQCDEGIRFVENFAKESYNGLTADLTNFALADPASWRGFTTLGITYRTTTPAITPSATTLKNLLLQFCDELFLSGSVYAQYFYNGSAVSFPPFTTPAAKWRNVESFVWVDLDEEVLGDAASEQNWEDLAVSYRFKTVGDPEDTGYGTTTATIDDYYLPGIDRGVYFLFRTASSNVTMTGLTGNPTMDVIDRGYIAVWTEDGSGNPLARFYRVDGINPDDNPVTVDVVQMGGDITGTDFNVPFDDGQYHKAEIILDGNDFYVYFDDVLLDFDGASGPSAVGGSSAIDKNYTDGSIGFGVKDVIAKFDNIQVCGCAPMQITAGDLTFPIETGVTLSTTDTIFGLPATGPVDWTVTPSDSGSFSSNPSTGASVIFTRSLTGALPDAFSAIDALGCVAVLLVPPPPVTCLTQNFDATDASISNTGFQSWVGSWVIAQDSANGFTKGIAYTGGNFSGVKLIRASSNPYEAVWSNHDAVDLYDDYTVEVDIRPTSTSTVAGLFFRNLSTSNAGYYLSISNDGGDTRVRLRYDGNLTDSGNYTNLYSVDTGYTYSTAAVYHLAVTVDGSTIAFEVYRTWISTGVTYLISSGSVTTTTRRTGGPGFYLYNSSYNNWNAYFDNFEICNLP